MAFFKSAFVVLKYVLGKIVFQSVEMHGRCHRRVFPLKIVV